jgi:hypothetical protein
MTLLLKPKMADYFYVPDSIWTSSANPGFRYETLIQFYLGYIENMI